MSLRFAWIAVAFLPFVAGCAADELDPEGAAYPEVVGTTSPNEIGSRSANPTVVSGEDPAVPEPSAPPADVVVGDGSDDEAPADGAGGPADGPMAGQEAAPGPGDMYGDADPAALGDFRSTLDPYGTWTDDPTYGTAWVPSPDVVGDDFAPYVSAGHWAYDDDYVWESDYAWGWAPFHYGRWAYGNVGWEWIPGRRYSGAWVDWRAGSGYVGWSPTPPAFGWRRESPVLLGVAPHPSYTFVTTGDLFSPSLRSLALTGPGMARIAAGTRPLTVSAAGLRGPSPSMLRISPLAVVHTTPGDRGVLQARAYARPSTAVALGARPPAGTRGAAYRGAVWRPSTTLGRGAEPSHFGGKLGVGFIGSPASAGPARSVGYRGQAYYGNRGQAYYGNRGAAYYGNRGPSYSGNRAAAPYYGMPRASSPAMSGYRGSSPGSLGGHAPESAPSFHSSSSAPSMGRGGFGGFHGGGGGGHSGGRR